MFSFVLVDGRLAFKAGVTDFEVSHYLGGFVFPCNIPTGISNKVEHRHLQFYPGGSDSGGPVILALRFSASEERIR